VDMIKLLFTKRPAGQGLFDQIDGQHKGERE